MTDLPRGRFVAAVRVTGVRADGRLARLSLGGWRQARAAAAASEAASASARWFRLLRWSFAVCVLLPALVAVVYALTVAAPLYTSEARLAVRGSLEPVVELPQDSAGAPAIPSVGSLAGLLGGSRGQGRAQDPFVLSSLIGSRSLVAELDHDGWLRARFAHRRVDILSGLSADASLETLWRYWNRHVTAAVDRRSNIVLLRVLAFSPREAQEIAERVIALGEKTLNQLNERARADTVRDARADRQRALLSYEAALAAQQNWRTRHAAIDPVQAAEAVGASLVRLEGERIAALRELESLRRLASADGPAQWVLLDRVRALDGEIARVGQQTSEARTNNRSIVAALAEFEETELDKRFAETLLSIATKTAQDAERRAREQGVFASVFLQPTLADEPSEPVWWQLGLFVFALAGIAWINTMILISIIRDRRI